MSTNPEKAVSYVLSKYVTEYMNKDVLKLSMKTQTRDAATMLRSYETDDIIVIDKKKFPVGIVTDEDILSKVSDATVYAEATTLEEIMSKPLITISEKSTLQDALHIMRDNNVRTSLSMYSVTYLLRTYETAFSGFVDIKLPYIGILNNLGLCLNNDRL